MTNPLLQKYAEMIVHVGLNLQSGQRLLVRAPIESAELVRLVTASAYRAGARLVTVLWQDEQLTLIRFQVAPRDSFEEFPVWLPKAMEEHILEGGALLSILAEDPDLLQNENPELIGIAMKTGAKYSQPVSKLIMRNATNWSIASMPVPAWAAKMFPELPPGEQIEKLWDAIYQVCRIKMDDPVAEWKEHVRQLGARAGYLTEKAYQAVHFRAPGTDLRVGLPAGHLWMGGETTTEKGNTFIPNIPTEEVFTMPHRNHVDGVVRATMPLSYGGKLIEDFTLTFKDGQVVDFQAGKNQDILKELMDTDEGARRLGEVALVAHSTPISQSGLLFYNTLFDENAASHLALGKAYKFTHQQGSTMTDEEFESAGGNHSLTHVDFMIGSAQTDLDGIRPDGTIEPLMRQGEWTFTV